MPFDTRSLKLDFAGSHLVDRHFSQAGQDLFVLSVLDGKRGGVFLDLGCNQPILLNNTYLLETAFGWNGLAVDVEEGFFELFVFRKCSILAGDATKLDWDDVIDSLGTTLVDYLSLDLEPPLVTLECLERIPFERLEFGVITFEHDAYRAGDTVRTPSRAIFEKNGYVRVCSNVKLNGLEFEDWYCNPKFVEAARSARMQASNCDWEQIVFV